MGLCTRATHADVWRAELGNLIRIPRYHFFLPGGFGVVERALDEDPSSGPLATITRLLLDVHARFFSTGPSSAPSDPRRPLAPGAAAAEADARAGAGTAAPEADGAVAEGEEGSGGCHASTGGAGPADGGRAADGPGSPPEPHTEAACGDRRATPQGAAYHGAHGAWLRESLPPACSAVVGVCLAVVRVMQRRLLQQWPL